MKYILVKDNINTSVCEFYGCAEQATEQTLADIGNEGKIVLNLCVACLDKFRRGSECKVVPLSEDSTGRTFFTEDLKYMSNDDRNRTQKSLANRTECAEIGVKLVDLKTGGKQ